MGSNTSKHLKIHNNQSVGNLSILLNEEFYYPTQEIKGTVCIEALQDILVYGVDLKFFSNEFWAFEKDKSDITRYNEEVKKEMSIKITDKLKACTSSEENYLPKGFYNLPFSFILPESIQPSFEFRGSSSQIQLRYAIYCCLMATKGDKYCLSNLNYVIIRSPPKALTSPLNISNLKNVHSWMFFSKGCTLLSGSYSRNNYKFADPIELKIKIDNTRGKLNVTEVKIRVIQKITFRDLQGEHNAFENIILEKIVSIGVEAGKSNEISQYVQVSYDKMNSEIYKSNIPYSHFVNNTLNVLKFQPSIESGLIKCEYSIKLSLYFDSFVSYKQRPRIEMPLWISHKTLEEVIGENKNLVILDEKQQGIDTIPHMYTQSHVIIKEITPEAVNKAVKSQAIQNKAINSESSQNNQSRYENSQNSIYNNSQTNLYANQHNLMPKITDEYEDINSFNYPLLSNNKEVHYPQFTNKK